MHEAEPSKEERILRAMKLVLTGVVKDTATAPGMRHPLRNETIEDIRQCLALISARERELAAAAGRETRLRPHYADEPRRPEPVVVPLHQTGLTKGKPKK